MGFQTLSKIRGSSVVVMVVFLATLVVSVMADSSMVPDEWYTAYTEYPEYCSTPAQMKKRTIPSLQKDARIGETRLVHVTTIIRHGARTPASSGYQCWDGYWENPATGVWNCDLKTQMAPPTPKQGKEEEGMDSSGCSDGVVLFEKHYDALMDPEDGLSNKLFGTCQAGQLLLQGYEQQITNGQILRDAYCYDSDLDVIDHDARMRLIDVNSQNYQPWAEPQLHIRSDDEQRVLISGQTLVRSMFEPEMDKAIKQGRQVRIPVHLADLDQDILWIPWNDICPRQKEMQEDFKRSSVFTRFNTSKEAHELRDFITNDLGVNPADMPIMDCLMTTVCTDRPLHPALENSAMFDRLATFFYQGFNMILTANNGEFAKLVMAPLWSEIMDNINPIINGEKSHSQTRFALFSGHDGTISPIMATLGLWNDTQWPTYASMFLIEIHEIIDGQADHSIFPSKFAFRLLYNGQVLTQQVDGCLNDAELCDIKVLTNMVSGFSSRDRDCNRKKYQSQSTNSTFSGPFHSFLGLLVGALVGGLVMSAYLKGSLPCITGHTRRPSAELYASTSMPVYSDDPAADRYSDGTGQNGGAVYRD